MRFTIILALFGLLATMLLAGCPRDTDADTGDSSANLEGKKPDYSQDKDTGEAEAAAAQDVDATAVEDEDTEATEGEDAEAGEGEETVDGEEAVEGEEATDGEEVAADEATDGETADEEPAVEETAAGVTTVVFETTKGDIVIEVHDDWAPIGAAHFIELVEDGFYDGAPWFRVIEQATHGIGVAQCGVSADPELNKKWTMKTITDEPVLQGNKPGYIAFGSTGRPNSRSTHIFINFTDNTRSLDVQGFTCFAKVVEGMDVVAKLHRCEYGDQGGLGRVGGIDLFKTRVPEADFITDAKIK